MCIVERKVVSEVFGWGISYGSPCRCDGVQRRKGRPGMKESRASKSRASEKERKAREEGSAYRLKLL